MGMDIETVVRKIFEAALPASEGIDAPIAYVNVVAGADILFDDRELWDAFNKIKWDSAISSAELRITRMGPTGIDGNDKKLAVVSISEFEDETGLNRIHNISPEKGRIL